jgi:hypothetical protein
MLTSADFNFSALCLCLTFPLLFAHLLTLYCSRRWTRLSPMKMPRRFHAMASLHNKAYVFGGRYRGSSSLNSCEEFDICTNLWTYLPEMPAARSYGAAVAVPSLNRVYMLGGEDNEWQVVNSVEYYDIRLRTWTSCTGMNVARSFLCAVCVGDYIYAIGGLNSQGSLRSVERYDSRRDTWSFISTLPCNLSGACASAVPL